MLFQTPAGQVCAESTNFWIMASLPASAFMFEAEKEMLQIFAEFEAEVSADAASSATAEQLPAASVPATTDSQVPHFSGEPLSEDCSTVQDAEVSPRRLARAVVDAALSSVSWRFAEAEDESSSDGSDDFLYFDPAIHFHLDDDHMVHTEESSVDSCKPAKRVLDQIQGKLVKVSGSAHRNMERVAGVVQHNMLHVAEKSKLACQAAKAKSERLEEGLLELSPKSITNAAARQSEVVQKNVQIVKSKTKELAAETIGFVKEKSVMMKDVKKAGFDRVKEKADIARGRAQTVSTTVSEKAHTSFDLVKEKAEVARGTAHAVSLTMSEKAHTGLDIMKETAKETARAMREGNYLYYLAMMPPHLGVAPLYTIRQRGGA